MKKMLVAALIALIALPVGFGTKAVEAESTNICQDRPGQVLDGLIVVTAYNQPYVGSEASYDVDYALNVYLTRPDGGRFSTLLRGYYNRTSWGQYFGYHIKCNADGGVHQDTLVTFINGEPNGRTSIYSECYSPEGAQVYTQAVTLQPGMGKNISLSVAACLVKRNNP